jgi:hypothetical protein
MNRTGSSKLGELWLDCALVRPGDVLLIATKGLAAAFIKNATEGPYSHIALVLNSVALLESEGDGIGHTILLRDRVEESTATHGPRILHRLPSNVTAAQVLRRPGLAEELDESSIDLIDLTRPFLWREYAELAALADTLKDRPLLYRCAPSILRLIETANRSKPERPGLFCSELVASVFEIILGEPLIKDRAAKEFSPNSFLDLDLDIVANAITVPDETAKEMPAIAELQNLPLRLAFSRQLLPDLVSFQNLVARLKQRADVHDKEGSSDPMSL